MGMKRSLTFLLNWHRSPPCFTQCRNVSVRPVFKSSTITELSVGITDVDGVERTINYIDVPAANPTHLDRSLPPLLLICGTAQTINTYTQHIRHLSSRRRLIIPELRGQGKTSLLSSHCTMPQLCADIDNFMDKMSISEVDLVGFSFGGRVALTWASLHPHRVRRLSLTGIALHRPAEGRFILQSWKEGLRENAMRSCAWSFILNGYSPSFIDKHQARLETYVDLVVQANPTPSKVYDLIDKSHVAEDDPRYSLGAAVKNLRCEDVQVIAGAHDRIAGHDAVLQLYKAIKNSSFLTLPTGHLIPFEDPQRWREAVLDFLNS